MITPTVLSKQTGQLTRPELGTECANSTFVSNEACPLGLSSGDRGESGNPPPPPWLAPLELGGPRREGGGIGGAEGERERLRLAGTGRLEALESGCGKSALVGERSVGRGPCCEAGVQHSQRQARCERRRKPPPTLSAGEPVWLKRRVSSRRSMSDSCSRATSCSRFSIRSSAVCGGDQRLTRLAGCGGPHCRAACGGGWGDGVLTPFRKGLEDLTARSSLVAEFLSCSFSKSIPRGKGTRSAIRLSRSCRWRSLLPTAAHPKHPPPIPSPSAAKHVRAPREWANFLTWRPPPAFLDRHVLRDLALPHRPQDRQPLPDRVDSHIPQRLVVQVNQDLARDPMLCTASRSARGGALGKGSSGLTSELLSVEGEPEGSEQGRDAVLVELVQSGLRVRGLDVLEGCGGVGGRDEVRDVRVRWGERDRVCLHRNLAGSTRSLNELSVE